MRTVSESGTRGGPGLGGTRLPVKVHGYELPDAFCFEPNGRCPDGLLELPEWHRKLQHIDEGHVLRGCFMSISFAQLWIIAVRSQFVGRGLYSLR